MGRLILITNDDGIDAGGIRQLAETAKAFGEVWVVAPESQRSGKSHSVTYLEPLYVRERPGYMDGGRRAGGRFLGNPRHRAFPGQPRLSSRDRPLLACAHR